MGTRVAARDFSRLALEEHPSLTFSKPFTSAMPAGSLVLALAALIAWMGGSLFAAATGLGIANTGTHTEGLPTFSLNWTTTSNSTYLVQSTTTLASGTPWTTLDAIKPIDTVGSYQFQVTAMDSTGLSSAPARFYRLIPPWPQIFSLEPAIVAPGVPVDYFVLGQSLPTNVVCKINGVTQAGTVYQRHFLIT